MVLELKIRWVVKTDAKSTQNQQVTWERYTETTRLLPVDTQQESTHLRVVSQWQYKPTTTCMTMVHTTRTNLGRCSLSVCPLHVPTKNLALSAYMRSTVGLLKVQRHRSPLIDNHRPPRFTCSNLFFYSYYLYSLLYSIHLQSSWETSVVVIQKKRPSRPHW